MKHEFYEPEQAAEVLHCSETWLRAGASTGDFPHLAWGKGKIVFTDEHLEEIAKSREVQARPPATSNQRLIGSRAASRGNFS